jgi:pimeloyl-ACP methyl ester carboxylesterase
MKKHLPTRSMKRRVLLPSCLAFILSEVGLAQNPSKPPDTTAHSIEFVTVQPGIKLEVLDYGGTGRAMVFLAALGPDAHEWDKFAPKFVGKYHVYAITRRGFGASDNPPPTDENYSADRLGDDVLIVMETLKMGSPILVGWSVGGEELSSVGSRFPAKVKALIYLDAGYPYAFYNRAEGDPYQDRAELRQLLNEAEHGPEPSLELKRRLLASMTQNEEELRKSIASDEKSQPSAASPPPGPPMPPMPPQFTAIMMNPEKYTKIPVPVLAIFATQRSPDAGQEEWRDKQIKAFEAGIPTAHVVRMAHAGHDVFVTNEADVIREMTSFLNALQ